MNSTVIKLKISDGSIYEIRVRPALSESDLHLAEAVGKARNREDLKLALSQLAVIRQVTMRGPVSQQLLR